MRNWQKLLIKIVITVGALVLTFRKVEFGQIWLALQRFRMLWLIPALLAYNLSQLCSSFRLLLFYRALGASISWPDNLRLYYTGMFYNLFLPGGIGGDGYKVHYLKKYYAIPVKQGVAATVIDRLNGLVILSVFLMLLFLLQRSTYLPVNIRPYLLVTGLIAFTIVYSLLIKRYFPKFFRELPLAAIYSSIVQVCQILAVVALMRGLGIFGDEFAYLLLFLISAIAAVIPVTIGGMGARELVFMSGAAWLGTNRGEGVTIGLLFFAITMLSALTGFFFQAKKKAS